ncbi:MAG: polyphosphate polymerase domain-containing protein [Lachnospiraceae bacterium]|jgi:SPX domain protein involved in polyphosphate accumulation|nr:polyphosphate polymerase domain-containing protein [Lachnospiraceae bacterium]
MAIEVFKRYENKYMLNELLYYRILAEVSKRMNPDPFNENGKPYQICNIYYDTEDSSFIRHSLEKPVYKEKLRLRSYGTPDSESTVYLGIKKKYKGIVGKRRTALKLSEAYDFLTKKVIENPDPERMNLQVIKEIEYILQTNKMVPKMNISYLRMAFFDKDLPDFRVSFDSQILARDYNLKLEEGPYGTPLIPSNFRLMEVKASLSAPLWFVRLLSDNKIYPTGFSKYGTAYMTLNNNEKENLQCLNQYLQQKQQTAVYR